MSDFVSQNGIYVPIHCHTEHSLLDGLSRPAELAARAKEIGSPACAITDHGAMSGCLQFYQACRKEGITPILGMEAYMTPYGHSLSERVQYDEKELRNTPGAGHQRNNYHAILLCKDYVGYTNLCALHTASYASGYYYKPRIDFELLEKHHEGLIFSNACFTPGQKVVVKSNGENGACKEINIEDVKAGQFVLTHEGRWRRVIEPTSRMYDGVGYRIELEHQFSKEPIECTANHKFFVYDSERCQLVWKAAEDLSSKDFLTEPFRTRRLYKQSNNSSCMLLGKDDLNKTHDSIFARNLSPFEEDVSITPELMMLFGLWLADGSITINNTSKQISFTFNIDEYEDFKNSIIDPAFTQLKVKDGYAINRREEHNRVDICVAQHMFVSVFYYLFGNVHAQDKFVPSRISHLSKQCDAALLYGYLLGDGHFQYANREDGGQVSSVSISKRLSRDIFNLWKWFSFLPSCDITEAYAKNGISHNASWTVKVNNTFLAQILDKIHIYDNETFLNILIAAQLWGEKKKQRIVQGDKYQSYFLKRIKTKDKVRLNQQVHCLNVEEDHSFICGEVAVHNCVLGEVNHHLLHEDYDMAREHALRLQDLFGEDYYFEIMNHGLDMEIAIMPRIREMAKELGIKVIGTNDSHFTRKEDHKLQRTMMLLGMHKSWADADVAGSFFEEDDMSQYQKTIDGDDGDSDPIFSMPPSLYVKTYDEMMEALCLSAEDEAYAREELANTLEIAKKCEGLELPIIDPNDMSQYHTPLYAIEKDLQYDDYKDTDFQLRPATEQAVIEAMNEAGKEGSTLDEVLTEHEHKSLLFLMWMCEKGIEERIKPKIEARGEPLPIEFYMENPPVGFEVSHKHNSPDESFIKGHIADGKTPEDIIQMYKDRLDYEVSIVCRKGFLDYFSIVQQYCNHARFHGDPPGPGRGSGAGALLNYLLGITSVDPLPNKLIFERFLNPDRVGYPDIDVDFSKAYRDNILKPYLRQEYGEDNAAGVSTFTYAWGKAAIKAAARVLYNPPESVQYADDLCKLIDDHPKLDLNSELQDEGGNEALKQLIASNRHYQHIIDLALMLQGRIIGTSIHASAFILSPFKITDKMPLTVPKAERERVQATGESVIDFLISYDGVETQESLGFVKLDLLCIKDLEVLTQTMKTIERVYGCKVDIENIPMDDVAVFQMLEDHLVSGIFQLDGSSGMAQVMDDVTPQSIEEINAVVALFRPGPMDYIPTYVEGKWNPQSVSYLDPRLEPILKDTYGVCCYQEQAMQITQAIGGFTGGQADNYRKQAAKKHMDQLILIKDDFIEGALKNDTDPKVAEALWEQLVKFGSYAFNRSHSAAYAYIAYRGGFLKAHFPECFLAAMCSIKPMMKKTLKVPAYLEEARQMGVQVKPPHVNYSMEDFDVPEKGVIAFGLGGIKRVGKGAGPIIAEREKNGPYKDFTDFCTRVPKEVGKAPIEALIKAGACDGLGWSRMAMEESIEQIIQFRKDYFKEKTKRDMFEDDLFGFGAPDSSASPTVPEITLVPPFDTEYSELVLMRKERDEFGMYFDKDPRDFSKVSRFILERELREQEAEHASRGTDDYIRFVNVKDIPDLPDKTRVGFIANVENFHEFNTKKGKRMAAMPVWDNGVAEESRFGFAPTKNKVKCTIFSSVLATLAKPMPDDVVYVTGRVSVDKDGQWPTAVLVDTIDLVAPDSQWLGSGASVEKMTEFAEAQSEMNALNEELSDPSSKRYLIPAISFKTTDDLNDFCGDLRINRLYLKEGNVQVSAEDDPDGANTKILHLKQTMGTVKLAAEYGGLARKIRHPKAARALARKAMLEGKTVDEIEAEQQAQAQARVSAAKEAGA